MKTVRNFSNAICFKFSQCLLSSKANNSGQPRYSKYVGLLLNRANYRSGKDGLEFNKSHLASGHPVQVSQYCAIQDLDIYVTALSTGMGYK